MSAKVNLGLTFYGGVSLAVFEAGIAYELVRAVQFSRAANRPAEVPEIHVDVVTGTSAGGLAALQLAAALAGCNTEAVLAKILSIWANDADITSLLPEPRFKGQGFLDNRRLRECVESILETGSAPIGQRLEDDLNETWVPPSYGAGDLDHRRLDPAGIYLSLSAVARSDSIYHDLQRVRGMCDALAVLEPLSRLSFSDADFRRKLLDTDAYQQIVTRNLNPEAHAFPAPISPSGGSRRSISTRRVPT